MEKSLKPKIKKQKIFFKHLIHFPAFEIDPLKSSYS